MNRIIGKIKGATDRSVVIGIAIIVLLVIVFGVVRFIGSNNMVADNDNDILGDIEIVLQDDNKVSNVALVSGALINRNSMTVRVPILAGELFDLESGIKRGCDNVIFAKREVAKRPAVLNAVLEEMFSLTEDFGFLPGNFVATQENLNFDNAVIENGVARVYLTGEVGPLAGVCDDPRIEAQIEEAALQFGTVSGVEIFLNGEVFEV